MLVVALADVQSQVSEYLNTSIAIIPAAKAFLEARAIPTTAESDPDFIEASRFWGYFYSASSTIALFYMDNNGFNLGWGMAGNAPVVLLRDPGSPTANVYQTEHGAIRNLSDFAYTIPFPDFQPLYIAKKSGQPYWSPIFLLQIGPLSVVPLITYVEPAYFADNGNFCCVVGIDVSVTAFETMLSLITAATVHHGKIFIADDTGTLIADSENGVGNWLAGKNYTGFDLLNATENSDPVMAAAARFLIDQYGSFDNIPEGEYSFKYKGSKQILLVGQYSRNNFKIYISIVISESEFFADLNTSRRITISLTVIAVVLGCVRYIFAWRIMAKKRTTTTPIPLDSQNSQFPQNQVSLSVSARPSRENSSAALFTVQNEPVHFSR